MSARCWPTTLVLCVLLAAYGPLAVGAEKEKPSRGGQTVCANLDESRLNLQDPVYVHGPFRPVVRKATVGDLIQLQISFPISPPFPEKACVTVSSRALTALFVAGTDGQVAILTPEPQQGGIGVGFFSAYLRANSPGRASATVTVSFTDGTTKRVPFSFEIAGKTKSDEPTKGTVTGPIHVFAFPCELTAQDKLVDGPGPNPQPIKIASETMLLWVDLMPQAKFAHPTLYVLIDGQGARVVKGQWWPELNGKRLFRGVNHGAVLPPTVLAKSRVEPESEPGTVEVFLYPYELTSGDVLEDGPSSTKPMKFSEETMLVWIDLLPTARFAHPTQHVLISKSGVKIVDGQWWPVLNGKMLLRGKNHAAAIPPMVLQ